MKIGFFDSGVGGYTILSAVRDMMPEYAYVFHNDAKNLPYGNKSPREIFEYTKAGVRELFEHGAILVVVACNTASVEAVRELQRTFLEGAYTNRKILGVVIPTVEEIVEQNIRTVLLIGTMRTVHSKKFERELEKLNSSVEVIAVATPTLATLIEEERLDEATQIAIQTVDTYSKRVEGVVLGCTHYTILKDSLRRQFPKLKIISQDEIIPKKLFKYLERHIEIKKQISRDGNLSIV